MKSSLPWLPVEIHRELVRVRPDLHPIGLLAPELDVGGDQVVGEDPTVGEERVVGVECVERLVERGRDGGDVRELLRRELVEVRSIGSPEFSSRSMPSSPAINMAGKAR